MSDTTTPNAQPQSQSHGSGQGSGGSTSHHVRPKVLQTEQQLWESMSRMHRRGSYSDDAYSNRGDVETMQRQSEGAERAAALEHYVQSLHLSPFGITNNGFELDAGRRFHGRLGELPFDKATAASSPAHHELHPHSDSFTYPLPSPRSSHHFDNNRSQLPRRNAFSKGIKLNDLQPPPPSRRGMSKSTQAAPPSQSSLRGVDVGVSEVASHHKSPHATEKTVLEDAATSHLRQLCMDIVQSAKEGKPPPPRARIKETVAEYHRSHHNPISPRDPNFTEIPSEFSQVLTYGLARSQTVQPQQSTQTEEEAGHESIPRRQTVRKATPAKEAEEATKEPQQSRFAEVKHVGHFTNEIELDSSEKVSCVTLSSTVG